MPDNLRHRGTTLFTVATLPLLLAAGIVLSDKQTEAPRPAPVHAERSQPVPEFPRPQPMLTTSFDASGEAEPTMVW